MNHIFSVFIKRERTLILFLYLFIYCITNLNNVIQELEKRLYPKSYVCFLSFNVKRMQYWTFSIAPNVVIALPTLAIAKVVAFNLLA